MNPALRSLAALAVGLVAVAPCRAQPVSVSASLGHAWTDNVYLSSAREGDHAWVPAARVAVDFGTFWTASYEGQADLYHTLTELSSDAHVLRLVANPAFGEDGQDEATFAVAIETLHNREAYNSLNFVGPRALASVSLEPTPWMAWHADLDLRYRRFYDDPTSDAVDLLPRLEARFTLPSRTTISPRVAYGLRYLPGVRGTGTGQRPDRVDQQIDVGLHVSQGLWPTGGLQADWTWRGLLGGSGSLPYKLTQAQFAFLSTDFLADGHRAYARYKQLLPVGLSLLLGVEVRTLRFAGWPAIDQTGAERGLDREDRRLGPLASFSFSRDVGEVHLAASLAGQWLRQWSTSADFDTTALMVGLEFALAH